MIPTAKELKALTDKAVEEFHKDLEKQAEDFLNDSNVIEKFFTQANNRVYGVGFDFKGEKYLLMPYVKKKIEALGYHTIVVDQTYLKIDWREER